MNIQNILVIEDDPDIREGVRILMEGENFHSLLIPYYRF